MGAAHAGPADIAVDAEGRVRIDDLGSTAVLSYDRGALFIDGLGGAGSLALSPDGRWLGFLTDARVPAANLLGEEGKGFVLAAALLRAASLGCEIGNHTWSHRKLLGQNYVSVRYEINNTNDVRRFNPTYTGSVPTIVSRENGVSAKEGQFMLRLEPPARGAWRLT